MKKFGSIIWGGALLVITAFLLLPSGNAVFTSVNSAHPYIMGFIKFAVLASMGELLALRISTGEWQKTKGLIAKAIVWGIIGIMIVFMFKFYPAGVVGMQEKGLLPTGSGFMATLYFGFFVSFFMNTTFAPAFMTVHRITDRYIEDRVDGLKTSLPEVVREIDWSGFLGFAVAKTVPFFWIPAHTVTFFLAEGYRVIFAAYLSICLGVLLSLAKKRTSKTVEKYA